jgi:hypothetical protein
MLLFRITLVAPDLFPGFCARGLERFSQRFTDGFRLKFQPSGPRKEKYLGSPAQQADRAGIFTPN